MSDQANQTSLPDATSAPSLPDAEARTRTYSWEDPSPGTDAGLRLSGVDFLNAMNRGELPMAPIFRTLGLEQGAMEIQAGVVAFSLRAEEYHYNPIGTIHGGVIATMLDSAVACAIHSMLPAGTGYTTLELKVNFTRALRADSGMMRCVGTVLTLGRQIGTAEGRLTDPRGRLCAHATTTCLIFPPKGT